MVNTVAAIIDGRCLEFFSCRLSYDTLASEVSDCGLSNWV